MKWKLFLLTITFSFFLYNAQSQTVQFTGKVLNNRNEVLPSATITITPSSKKIVTDVEGKFVVALEIGTNI